MRSAIVRAWLVYFFTLLSVASLNIDGVSSWYVNKGDGQEAILNGLAALKHAHTEVGVGPLMTWLECTAGPAFEGSYKDKSKCREVPAIPTLVAVHQPEAARAIPDGPKTGEVPADWSAPAELQSEPVCLPAFADRDLALHEPERHRQVPAGSASSAPSMNDPNGHARDVGTPGEIASSSSSTEVSGTPANPVVALRETDTSQTPGGGPLVQEPSTEPQDNASFQSVLLIGDSLAHGLALSLGRDLKDRGGAAFSFVAKVSSGLNNPNLFNWEKTMRMLIEHGAPDLVLIMMGVNDANNHIREGNRLCAVGTPEWCQAYENRVESFLRIASETHIRICWIGVPVVREEELQNRVLLANMAARNACRRVENCRFIDTFEVFCDENRKYTNYLKETDGTNIRIRARDGIHFSMEGGNLLSRRILQELHDAPFPNAQN